MFIACETLKHIVVSTLLSKAMAMQRLEQPEIVHFERLRVIAQQLSYSRIDASEVYNSRSEQLARHPGRSLVC